ncbi:YihY/virulence factor BrkB family protein [Ornithinibacillus halotolerans]|uniref:Transporter n=1 Tax=Ornithinibacillus halotolerans TaxID=1274357 RepID=A0A916S7Y4_9BACI|nr:YihY/virulence factor BrkB family protein [Ornithinibacillus halotolerans]GGA89115.1 transporter [Ornithinibacillus halotolerans]
MNLIVTFLKKLVGRILEEEVFGLSAQLAYFFLLSLFPLLVVLITLVGYLPVDSQILITILSSVAPADSMKMIEENIEQLVSQQNGQLLSIGIIGTLWAASNGINAIMRVLNNAYEVEEDRFFLVSRLIAIVLTIAMVGVVVLAILLPVLGKMIGVYLFSFFGLSDDFITIWEMLRWVLTSIVFFIVFLFLYKLAPNVRVRFREAFWGALFATFSWQLTSLAFSYYVSNLGNYSATYGSLGAVITLMIWFYISAFIVIVGGILNATLIKMR